MIKFRLVLTGAVGVLAIAGNLSLVLDGGSHPWLWSLLVLAVLGVIAYTLGGMKELREAQKRVHSGEPSKPTVDRAFNKPVREDAPRPESWRQFMPWKRLAAAIPYLVFWVVFVLLGGFGFAFVLFLIAFLNAVVTVLVPGASGFMFRWTGSGSGKAYERERQRALPAILPSVVLVAISAVLRFAYPTFYGVIYWFFHRA
jgi:hypothetical protein